MSIEIGSLVVRGSFGRAQGDGADAISEEKLSEMLQALRREMRDELVRATEVIERRLRET